MQVEQRAVRDAWGQHRVHLLPAARLRDLALAVAERPFSLLHFAGHGEAGGLLVHSDADEATPLSASVVEELLALAVRRHRAVELLVLNGCCTAPLAGALARTGLKTIGVEGLVDDAAAERFADVLHRRLATEPGDWRSHVSPAFLDARAAAVGLGRADYRLFP